MEYISSGIVLWKTIKGKLHLFLGKNGAYLKEYIPKTHINIEALETISDTTIDSAIQKFSATAKQLQQQLGMRIQFSLPNELLLADGTKQYKTIFFYLKEDSKFGFIKGSIEAGEIPSQTVNREFFEETGVKEDIFNYSSVGTINLTKQGNYYFYSKEGSIHFYLQEHDMDDKLYMAIYKSLEFRKGLNLGELFDAGFYDIDVVVANKKILNQISEEVLNHILANRIQEMKGGRKRKRKTYRRKYSRRRK